MRMPSTHVVLLALTIIFLTECHAKALQLISFDEVDNYTLHQNALRAIERLPEPIRVLSAVGDARIGKSTFLNMLHLNWGETSDGMEPFGVASTTKPCTRGLWVHTGVLHGSEGSLILVDVEGANLGNDVVTEQLSALTAIMSSYIILFVREVVTNPSLVFLYHTTKLGQMFPDSDTFPHLGVAIRDPLDLNKEFSDRHAEVVYAICNTDHGDEYDKVREEISKVFCPDKVTAFEVSYQDKKELTNLPKLKSGPYYESVVEIVKKLRKLVPSKQTPSGLEMCGGDLVQVINALFNALKNGDIKILQSAFERLEKQMCEDHRTEVIVPLMELNEEDFLSNETSKLDEFEKLCKIASFVGNVKQEINIKKEGILHVMEERKKTEQAEQEKKKAEEERAKAEEESRKAYEAKLEAEQLKVQADLARVKAEEDKEKEKIKLEYERKLAEERRRAAEAEKKASDERFRDLMKAQEKLQEQYHQLQMRGDGGGGGPCIIL